MKKTILLSLSAIIGLGLAVYGGADASAASNELYRVYNPNSGEHFYTESASERDGLVRQGWTDEGLGWNTPTSGETVYRVYNANAGDHHYTKSVDEYNWLANQGWTKEGKSFFSSTGEEVAIHRAYNPNAVVGSHNFTQSASEQNWLVNEQGWTNEGVAFYGVNADTTEVNKDALRAAITSALALNEADYTTESYAQLVTALNAAQAVVEKTDATQAEVDAQVTALQAAVDALEAVTPAETDKTTLEAKITEAKAIEGTDYTAESYQALQDAITAAETVFNDADATQAQVDAQVTALDAAIAGLEEAVPTVNKTDLQARYDLVKGYSVLDFEIMADFGTFEDALANAKTTLDSATASQTEVDAALALLEKVDVSFKRPIREAIETLAAKGYAEADYPAADWAIYQTALAEATAKLTSQIGQSEVSGIVTKLNTAASTLDGTKYTKTTIQALVAEINAFNLTATNYTEASWKVFDEALKTATSYAGVENLEPTQAQVVAADKALRAAYKDLVYVKDFNDLQAYVAGLDNVETTTEGGTTLYGAFTNKTALDYFNTYRDGLVNHSAEGEDRTTVAGHINNWQGVFAGTFGAGAPGSAILREKADLEANEKLFASFTYVHSPLTIPEYQ